MKQTIRAFRFGPFQLDLARYTLTRSGLTVRISGSQMELLSQFVSRPGELITREQIVAALWKEPQSVDIRQGINTAVTRLRGVLRDDPAAPRYIETVIGKGYRFIANVEELETEESRQSGPDPDVAPLVEEPVYLDPRESTFAETSRESSIGNGHLPQTRFAENELSAQPLQSAANESDFISADGPSRRSLVLGGVCMLIFGCFLVATLRNRSTANAPHEAPGGSAIRSVAVIPLVNLSDDKEQQYFADGLTDALISNLAAGTRLRVTSRASSMHFQGLNLPSGDMAKQLGVDALVEGSVVRMGDRLRVTVHLVDARLDRDLWSQSFDTPFGSSLAVVGNIGQKVSRSLALSRWRT